MRQGVAKAKKALGAALAASLLLAALMLMGCTAPIGEGIATVESAAPLATPQPGPSTSPQPIGGPLSLARDVRNYKDGYIVYPRVFGSTAEAINEAIYNEVAARAEELENAIFSDYKVQYNDDGIFSVLIYVRDFETDEQLFLVPLTFDAATGERLGIAELMNTEDDTWRRVLPELAAAQAEQRGIVLLSELMPIADDQQFYVTASSLVLVYRLYEVATYSAGSPELGIPYSLIKEHISPSSPLLEVMEGD